MVTNQVLGKTSQKGQEEGIFGMPNPPGNSGIGSPVPTNHIQPGTDIKQIQGRFSPGRNLLIIVGGIAIAEIIAMIVVYFFRSLPYYQQVALDSALMTLIIFPLIYLLSTRPLLQHLKHRIRTENILEARLRIIQFARTHPYDELLQATLDEIELLTGSSSSSIHLIESDQITPGHTTWSTKSLNDPQTSAGGGILFGADQTGIREECLIRRQAVIHNDPAFPPHPRLKSGKHNPIAYEAAVPIFRNDRIVAILRLANTSRKYTDGDVELVTTFADFAWDIINYKQAGEALRESEEKFRTLVDWTYDWEIWLDPRGSMVYISPSCLRITGYSAEEFKVNPDLLMQIIHPDDRSLFVDHNKLIRDETAGMENVEYRIITRDGNERWLEHICRPLFGDNHSYLGRRVSNRDITERKQTEEEIRERSRKEQQLSQTIHTMQLDIARDLHDTIGQNISFLRMKLDHLAMNKSGRQTKLQHEIRSMAAAANESYDLIRGTLAILQSANSLDLYRLFTRYAEQLEERSTFKMECTSRGEPKPLTAPRMRQLFYVFREIMNNIEKHANAACVTLDMTWDSDELKLVIIDDGRGFDPHQILFGSHYGLKFMKERVELLGGTIAIHSSPGSGTNVEVTIPYEQS